jgi:polyisoprenoid-binding protein YceI
LTAVSCAPAASNSGEVAPTATTTTPAQSSASQPSAQTTTYSIVPEESEARYRVREQLLGQSLPSDAIGRTKTITGSIVVDSGGRIVSEQSKFAVDLRTLRSNESRRDNYIQGTTLQTRLHPMAEFVVTGADGLQTLVTPPVQPTTFQLIGDLTVRGVTRQATWEVSMQPANPDVTGSASTAFALTDFGMTPPRVGPVLGIEDKVTLELDFTLRANQGLG